MTHCADERTSQHYRAKLSLGPIGESERVLFALFGPTSRAGQELLDSDFDTKRLNAAEESVARFNFTSAKIFNDRVARLDGTNTRPLRGIATVTAKRVREISFNVLGSNPAVGGLAFCMVDKVSTEEDDGHGVIAYSEAIQQLTENQKRKLKPLAKAELAKRFGLIVDPRASQWRSHFFVCLARAFARARWKCCLLAKYFSAKYSQI